MDRHLSKMICACDTGPQRALWRLPKYGKPARFSGEPAG
jgi:hypothetical protein